MAPEQITKTRKDLTASADIHGLGAILYHMLTGRPPYLGATVLETIDLVQRQELLRPRRLNPGIPANLETICRKCLEKDPRRRYSSAESLADDLGRWQNGRPIAARPISPLRLELALVPAPAARRGSCGDHRTGAGRGRCVFSIALEPRRGGHAEFG